MESLIHIQYGSGGNGSGCLIYYHQIQRAEELGSRFKTDAFAEVFQGLIAELSVSWDINYFDSYSCMKLGIKVSLNCFFNLQLMKGIEIV